MSDDDKKAGALVLTGFAIAGLVYAALPARARRQVIEAIASALPPAPRTESKAGKVIPFLQRAPDARFRQ